MRTGPRVGVRISAVSETSGSYSFSVSQDRRLPPVFKSWLIIHLRCAILRPFEFRVVLPNRPSTPVASGYGVRHRVTPLPPASTRTIPSTSLPRNDSRTCLRKTRTAARRRSRWTVPRRRSRSGTSQPQPDSALSRSFPQIWEHPGRPRYTDSITNARSLKTSLQRLKSPVSVVDRGPTSACVVFTRDEPPVRILQVLLAETVSRIVSQAAHFRRLQPIVGLLISQLYLGSKGHSRLFWLVALSEPVRFSYLLCPRKT